MLSTFGDRTCRPGIHRSAQQGRAREAERGSKIMDLRLGPPSRKRIFPRQYSSEGLRAVIEEQGPRAEEMAARYVEHTRPVWTWIALEWRRVGTVAALILTLGLVLHAMFGTNGM